MHFDPRLLQATPMSLTPTATALTSALAFVDSPHPRFSLAPHTSHAVSRPALIVLFATAVSTAHRLHEQTIQPALCSAVSERGTPSERVAGNGGLDGAFLGTTNED